MEMTKTSQLTLIAFENNWCAQCYTERPVVDDIAAKFSAQLIVKKVNADEGPQLAQKYNVQSAPTVILIKDGDVVEKIPRFIDRQQLEAIIRYYL